jgi:lysophospholipid acyltransferase 7
LYFLSDYFCLLGPAVYLPVEDMYLKVFTNENASNLKKKITNLFYWISKFFAFGYMGTAFLLRDIGKIWHYYSSVYHFVYVFWAITYIGCIFILKQRKAAMKRKEKLTTLKSE